MVGVQKYINKMKIASMLPIKYNWHIRVRGIFFDKHGFESVLNQVLKPLSLQKDLAPHDLPRLSSTRTKTIQHTCVD